MDDITVPVLKFMLDRGDNVIYVRPAPDKDTVQATLDALSPYEEYKLIVIRLDAAYDTLLQRAEERNDVYRISNKKDLDEYINSRPVIDVPGEHIIMTDHLTPNQVVDEIVEIMKDEQ